MNSLWTTLKGQAIAISVANDAFNFEISWLGIVIVVGLVMLIRHLRR